MNATLQQSMKALTDTLACQIERSRRHELMPPPPQPPLRPAQSRARSKTAENDRRRDRLEPGDEGYSEQTWVKEIRKMRADMVDQER